MPNANAMLHGMVWSLTTIQSLSMSESHWTERWVSNSTLLTPKQKWTPGIISSSYRTNNRIGSLLFDSWICLFFEGSTHTGHVDIALNDTCRMITGCLKATPISCLYALAGIAPPHIRRKVASNADRCLQEDDPRHPLHGQRPVNRLPSRNSFLDSTQALTTSKQDARTTLWVEEWEALG